MIYYTQESSVNGVDLADLWGWDIDSLTVAPMLSESGIIFHCSTLFLWDKAIADIFLPMRGRYDWYEGLDLVLVVYGYRTDKETKQGVV
ncbi:hypothetical protein ACLOJK_031363 [Asimina triloba]